MKILPLQYLLFTCLFLSTMLIANVHAALVQEKAAPEFDEAENSLIIPVMQHMNFAGSEIAIEEELPEGGNYDRYLVRYTSEEDAIFGLLTVPKGKAPRSGYPGVVFVHGYIPPQEYKTGEQYSEYIDSLAKNGYVVFQPDLRGHGNSGGVAEGAYFSPAYTVDILNAVASMEKLKWVDSRKIGIWGHSMGAHIALRSLVVSGKLKAAVLWSGVVGTYDDLLYSWKTDKEWEETNAHHGGILPAYLIAQYGSSRDNPSFWKSITPSQYLTNIEVPVQIHHGVQDVIVPIAFSQKLQQELEQLGKYSELYEYEQSDHTFQEEDFEAATTRTLQFFNLYLQ